MASAAPGHQIPEPQFLGCTGSEATVKILLMMCQIP